MNNQMLRVEDVARELDVSVSYAYKVIRQLNKELKEKGFITIAGRINRQYMVASIGSIEASKCISRAD